MFHAANAGLHIVRVEISYGCDARMTGCAMVALFPISKSKSYAIITTYLIVVVGYCLPIEFARH